MPKLTHDQIDFNYQDTGSGIPFFFISCICGHFFFHFITANLKPGRFEKSGPGAFRTARSFICKINSWI